MTVIEQLHQERAELAARKAKITESIIALNQRLILTMPRPEYARVAGMKNELVKQLQVIEAQLTAINAKKHAASMSDQRDKGDGNVSHVRQLIELRDGYQAFAADGTRSPTMRRMASEFVVKLAPIIRLAISKKSDSE